MHDAAVSNRIEIIGITGVPVVKKGDSVARLIFEAAAKQGIEFKDMDVLVVASKIVAKAEGRVVKLSEVIPSRFAKNAAKVLHKDPREVETILRSSRRIVKMRRGLLLTESHIGVVSANAGVDKSNVEGDDVALLLPYNPDVSARKIRKELGALTGKNISVIISDTVGRAWREGQVDIAIGASGIGVIRDYRGLPDMNSRTLKVTAIAQADELASAAELVMGKSKGVPAAIIRGYSYETKEESARKLNRRIARDLFR